MDENLRVVSERVDDIPLLLAELERMGVSDSLDTYFPTHGNWKGLSLGSVTSIWLSHILSEGDHRLNHVEEWAVHRLESLRCCTGELVGRLDFTDDRLALILRELSKDASWDNFECALNGTLLRVYALTPEVVRLDSTSASGSWEVTEGGLFQFGYSKDHRPDLPQVKVMLSSLDPLGMPLCCEVLSGEKADDPLYIPAIGKVQQTFKKNGLLYIGDAKMASLETRAFIAGSGDYYLCPLPKAQLDAEELESYLHPVWSEVQGLTSIYREKPDGELEKLAEGYEQPHTVTAEGDGHSGSWVERHLIVHSLKLAQAAQKSLDKRIAKTREHLLAFNERKRGKKRYHSKEELQPEVEKILQGSQVQDLLEVEYHESGGMRRLRKYKDNPQRWKDERDVKVSVSISKALYEQTIQRFGWRVYATNAPQEGLPLPKAALAYRNEFIIERDFGRLKGKPLSLRPMYLQCEEHIVGLIRLLSIALKVLTLIEYQLRRQLAKQQITLAGLYKGNPKRATDNPTTEQALKAFQYITLTIIHQQQHTTSRLTELNQVQRNILQLLGFSINIYTRLAANFQKPG